MRSRLYLEQRSSRDQSIARWLVVIAICVILLSAALAF
jgi:hypothetical protein